MVLQQPEVVQRMANDGSESVGSTPAEFAAHIKSEIKKWSDALFIGRKFAQTDRSA